jgi:hypothetical protein
MSRAYWQSLSQHSEWSEQLQAQTDTNKQLLCLEAAESRRTLKKQRKTRCGQEREQPAGLAGEIAAA